MFGMKIMAFQNGVIYETFHSFANLETFHHATEIYISIVRTSVKSESDDVTSFTETNLTLGKHFITSCLTGLTINPTKRKLN